MAEYNNNPAGAEQYILDQINELDAHKGSDVNIYLMLDSRVTGCLHAFRSLGLIDIFALNDLTVKQSAAFSRFLGRITSPAEQI